MIRSSQTSPDMILLVIASLFFCKISGNPISGGQPSEIYKYPYVASIQTGGFHECGGSIISSTTILTTAHCAKFPLQSYVIRVGSTRTDSHGSWHYVTAIKQHENYTETGSSILDAVNDVALIKVSPPMKIGINGALIQLPSKGYVARSGTNVTVMGWGSMSEGGEKTYELRSVNLHVADRGECSRAYGDVKGDRMRSEHKMCAFGYHRGFCHGDSGSPLVTKDDIQIGIAFAGYGCGDNVRPGVYQDVTYYRDWIYETSMYL